MIYFDLKVLLQKVLKWLIKIEKIQYLNKKIFLFIFIYLFSFSTVAFTNKDLTNVSLLCPKLFWGFEFISSNKVRVVGTDLNKKSTITEYYYDIDYDLSFINIFQSENKKRNRVYSIALDTLRVDIWTMTGGGFTTREMFPKNLCKFVKNDNLLIHIESLKSFN